MSRVSRFAEKHLTPLMIGIGVASLAFVVLVVCLPGTATGVGLIPAVGAVGGVVALDVLSAHKRRVDR